MDFELRFQPSGIVTRVESGTTVWAAARAAGLPMASACSGDGLCARCGVRLLSGCESVPDQTPAEARAKSANRVDPDLRLACRVAVAGDLTVTAPYW